MTGATFLFGYLALMPIEFDALSMSVRSSIFFASNFWFARRVDYFDQSSDQEYLLHYWSLAIEEQYYLIIPLALMGWWMVSGKRTPAIFLAVLFFVSLTESVILSQTSPLSAYFMLYTRAWELMAGGLLAVWAANRAVGRVAANALGVAGVFLCAASGFMLSENVVFPGYLALLPTLGAVFLLASGLNAASVVSRLLAHPVLVGVGLISYPLYLWHWPVITAARTIGVAPEKLVPAILIFVLSMAFAYATWRWIELPIRRWRTAPPRRAFAMLGSLSAVFLGATILVEATDGLPQRLPAELIATLDGKHSWKGSPQLTCMGAWPDSTLDFGSRTKPDSPCFLGNPVGPVAVVLWGDSHAATLAPAVSAAAAEAGLAGGTYTKGGCLPVPYKRLHELTGDRECLVFAERTVGQIEASNAKVVLLAGRWPTLLEGGYGVDLRFAPRPSNKAKQERAKALAEGLRRLKDRMERSGKQVILIHPVPEMGANVPSRLGVVQNLGLPLPTGPERALVDQRQKFTRSVLEKGLGLRGSSIVDPVEILCSTTCLLSDGLVPLYFDSNHLSEKGAMQLKSRIRESLVQASHSDALAKP